MIFITAQSIYQQTNGGLDIITAWIPESANCVTSNKHFRFDESDSKASCTLSEYGGFWWVKNYGEDWDRMRGIDVVMRLERISFTEACQLIASRLQLTGEDNKKADSKFENLKDVIKSNPAKEGQIEGFWNVKTRDFTETDLKTVFAVNTWQHLCRKPDGTLDREEGTKKAIAICKRYNFAAVEYYEYVKRNDDGSLKHIKFTATEAFPIFVYQEKDFSKIYQPKGELRFRYFGNLPKQFVHGLAQHIEVYKKKNEEIDFKYQSDIEKAQANGIEPGEKNWPREPTPWQHPQLAIGSGGSDCLNIEAMGVPPVWLNSESDIERLSDNIINEIKKIAKYVYILFDLDDAGKKFAHKLNIKHLSLRTVFLPDTLANQYDAKGKPCKDLRDYLNLRTRADFKTLLNNSKPYQFWEEEIPVNRDGTKKFKDGEVIKKFTIITTYAINFLSRSGFGKLQVGTEQDGTPLYQFIQLNDNVIVRVTGDDMRAYLSSFLDSGMFDWRLKEVFSNTAQLSDPQLQKLLTLTVDFNDFDENTQYKTFQTGVLKITKDEITEIKPEKSVVKIWQHEVIKPTNYAEAVRIKYARLKLMNPMFEIFKDDLGRFRIKILDNSCLFFRFLTNASRIWWREELEDRLEEKYSTAEERNDYREKNRFNIHGELLDDDQIQEQEQHLINKITAFGYMLHGYKKRSEAYMPWFQDHVMRDTEKSQGGTGKSTAMESLKILMSTKIIDGRREEGGLNDKFFLAGVTKHTDFLFIDDPTKSSNIQQLFNMVTGNMEVRDLGKAPRTIDFHDSPKIGVASNFPPAKLDVSLARRIKFSTFSDYYHNNADRIYRETRKISDDFQKDLFSQFTETEWNAYFNFMAQCCQAFMQVGYVDTPGDNVLMNTIRNEIGQEFIEWADLYFDVTSDRLDTYIRRKPAFHDYEKSVKYSCGDKKFKDKLRQWGVLKGFYLNPAECIGYRKEGERITAQGSEIYFDPKESIWKVIPKKNTIEYFYLRTSIEKPISDFYDEFDSPAPQTIVPTQPKTDGLGF